MIGVKNEVTYTVKVDDSVSLTCTVTDGAPGAIKLTGKGGGDAAVRAMIQAYGGSSLGTNWQTVHLGTGQLRLLAAALNELYDKLATPAEKAGKCFTEGPYR